MAVRPPPSSPPLPPTPRSDVLGHVQKLDLSTNLLTQIPRHCACLVGLRMLILQNNFLTEVPVSVLAGMTAIQMIDFTCQSRDPQLGEGGFSVPESLLPVLHPGLWSLDLRQTAPFVWDAVSLFHLGRALAEVCSREPVPMLTF